MVIDIHTHTPTHRAPVPPADRRPNPYWRPDRVVEAAVSWDDYLQAMAPVDRACVFGIQLKDDEMPAGREGAGVPWAGNVNDATAEFASAHPDKLVGFMSVHPEVGDVVAEMERCATDLNLRGVKLGPNYQQFDPLGRPARLIYETAERLGLPILFHQGASPMRPAPLRYAHPLLMDEIAIDYPELRIVMAHLGHPWQVDTFTVIRKHPHVYADISAGFYRPLSFYTALRDATEWNVLDKLLFGSDYPVSTPQETIDGLLRVNDITRGTALPTVPEEQLQALLERDALALLGITDAARPPSA